MMIAARKTQRYAPVILRRLVKKRLQCRQIVGGKDAADDGSGDGNFFSPVRTWSHIKDTTTPIEQKEWTEISSDSTWFQISGVRKQ